MADHENDKEPAVGIDLGTTYSCVAVFQNGKAKVLPDECGNSVMPSCVGFTDNGYIVGHSAKYRLSLNTQKTVYDVKRLLGRTFTDPVVQGDIPRWPFDVVDVDNKPMIKIFTNGEHKTFAPEQISSMVLSKMKDIAEKHLNTKVDRAVITVPAHFNNSQREATKTAARLAGLEVLRIINEPTAAAMAYGYKQNHAKKQKEETIMIFDLGGGTFDVSILKVDDDILQVLATGGDTHLGGIDIDNTLVDLLLNHANTKMNFNEPLTTNKRKSPRHRLAYHAEFAKCDLSTSEKSIMKIDDLQEGRDLDYVLHISLLEELNDALFCKTIDHVRKTLDDAKLDVSDIDQVILVGGSTRIPKLQMMLREFFKKKQLCKTINPDEAVARGAAIQAAILLEYEEVEDTLLLDVNHLPYGLEIRGRDMWTIVHKNSTLPTDETTTATTVVDNQREVELVVFEGEDKLTRNNHYLGKFSIGNLRPAPAGTLKIEVKFEVDQNGLLHVSGKDLASGTTQSVKIKPNKAYYSGGGDDKDWPREDTAETQRQTAYQRLMLKKQWVKHLLENKFPELKIMRHVADDIMEKCQLIEIWTRENPQATEADILNQLGELNDLCRDLPAGYQEPGRLPDRTKQITFYIPPEQRMVPQNEDNDWEHVPELD